MGGDSTGVQNVMEQLNAQENMQHRESLSMYQRFIIYTDVNTHKCTCLLMLHPS